MRLMVLLMASLLLSGCATKQVGYSFAATPYSTPPSSPKQRPKTIVIAIDGTSNTLISRTNAGRLFELIEVSSYQHKDRLTATWYANGVGSGSGDFLGAAAGLGMSQDIKNAYAFLTQVWESDDQIIMTGFSRGAYGVRALGGMLYMAGIPDLRKLSPKQRAKIVDDLFDAHKTGRRDGEGLAEHNARRADRIARALGKYPEAQYKRGGEPGYSSASSKVIIDVIAAWDTVAALGLPDSSQNPLEGHDHYLLTACNVRNLFHALALDENRSYSFTPIMTYGSRTEKKCKEGGGQQFSNKRTEEVWFAGAHSDVSGTYANGDILDGDLPGVSLNWMIRELEKEAPGLVLHGLRVPENRLSGVHDAERDGIINRPFYRLTRKPSIYSLRAYDKIEPIKIHASVLDRLEWLFALDGLGTKCPRTDARGASPLLCAENLSTYGFIPELKKRGCLTTTAWGYTIVRPEDPTQPPCVEVVEDRTHPKPAVSRPCLESGKKRTFTGKVYRGELEDTKIGKLKSTDIKIPYPECLTLIRAAS